MKGSKLIIFVLTVMLLGTCTVMAMSDADRQHYESNKHNVSFGTECKDCHGVKNPTVAPIGSAECVSCHGEYEELAKTTASIDPNPHKTHFTDMPCSECHNIHKPSVNMCKSCHNLGFNVP